MMIQSYIDSPVILTSNTDVVRFQHDGLKPCSASCSSGLQHTPGSALYKLFKCGNYEINFSGTISSATAGVVALALYIDGQPVTETIRAETLGAANDVASVSFTKAIKLCCSNDVSISIGSVSNIANATDVTTPIVTQIPIILNGNLIITKIP